MIKADQSSARLINVCELCLNRGLKRKYVNSALLFVEERVKKPNIRKRVCRSIAVCRYLFVPIFVLFSYYW
jgi:hypothetical protein